MFLKFLGITAAIFPSTKATDIYNPRKLKGKQSNLRIMQMNRRSLKVAAQAVAFSFLIIYVNKVSGENDAAESLADPGAGAQLGSMRQVRAAPLRWGKRSAPEETDASIDDKAGPQR